MGVELENCLHSMEVQKKFMEHVSEFGLSYGTKSEYEFRLNLFAQTDANIEAHNAKNGSLTLGHNIFSTYTPSEKKRLLGYKDMPKFLQSKKEAKVLDDSNL